MLPYKKHTESDVIIIEFTALGLMEGPDLDGMAEELQEELMRSQSKRLVMDCSRLKFIASRGVSVFITLANLAGQYKGGVALCGLQPPVRQIIKLAGADRTMIVCATRQEALASFSPPRSGE